MNRRGATGVVVMVSAVLVVFACSDEATTPAGCTEGTTCSRLGSAGVCRAGACVLTCTGAPTACKCDMAADCPAPTECAQWACTGGRCASTGGSVGKPVANQVAGDCQSKVCGADGTAQSQADDNDVPASTECATSTCTNGAPTTKPLAFGAKCSNGLCDGKGACVSCLNASDLALCGASCAVKLCKGETCSTKEQCQSAFCADGVCCGDACTDECKSCGLATSKGTCSNIPYYEPDLSYTDPVFQLPNVKCENFQVCDGKGKCLKRIGKACAVDADCISGKCFPGAKVCLGAKDEACSSNGSCVSGKCNGQGACD